MKISKLLSEFYKFIYTNVFCFICNRHANFTKEKPKQKGDKELGYLVQEDSFVSTVFSADIDTEEKDDESKVTVPLILVLLSLFGYLFIGGYLFTQLGDDWTLVESIYSSYQAVATIGKAIFFLLFIIVY